MRPHKIIRCNHNIQLKERCRVLEITRTVCTLILTIIEGIGIERVKYVLEFNQKELEREFFIY